MLLNEEAKMKCNEKHLLSKFEVIKLRSSIKKSQIVM